MPTISSRTTAILAAIILPSLLYSQDKTPPKDAKPAAEADAAAKPKSLKERVSYSYGVMIAMQLTQRGVDLDLDQFTKAYKAIAAGKDPLLSPDEINGAFAANQKILDEKNATAEDKATLLAGKKFLEENGKKEGVITTSSGLQYKVLKAGDGAKPKATDKVKVHYHGTLLDGTVFDSSVERGEPVTFGLNQVIPGWTEGVQLMPKGSKYRFFIPYDLAYGSRATGKIKPYSTLIFDVEFLGIEK